MSIIAKLLPLVDINNLDDIDLNIQNDKTKAELMQIYVNNSNVIDHKTLASMIYCCAINNGNKVTFKEIEQGLSKPHSNSICNVTLGITLLLFHMYFLSKKI